jgi:hypothetical protein
MNNSKTKWLISFITIILMLAVVTGVNAQSTISATLSVDRSDITVGDVIPLTLRVIHPAGWRVIVPALEKQWGEFELRSQSTPVITASGPGSETTSQIIEVARLRPGEVQTPALTLAVADDQGNLQDVEVAPVALLVQSVLVAGDTTLRDLKPQADLITSQRTFAPVIVVAALTLIVWGMVAIRRWRSRPVVDNRTPRQRALDTLKTLETRDPQTPEAITAACADLAGCLRNYIAATTPVPARDLTTSELARQLKQNDIPADWSLKLIEVLRVCDSVKFARDVVELTTVQGLIDIVDTLVKQYPTAPAQPAAAQAQRAQLNRVIA